jgi:hypothetical protein
VWRSSVWLLGACGLLASSATAAFIGPYDLANWSLINTNGDGSVMTPDGGQSIVLSGPNNGSGLGGSTDILIAAASAGLCQFDWSYSSLDGSGFDSAGYLAAGAFSPLADTTGELGSAAFVVNAGDEFGFRVLTVDNWGEPGILTISRFDVSQVVATPEPGSFVLCLSAAAAFGFGYRRIRTQPPCDNRIDCGAGRLGRRGRLGERRRI